MASDLALADVPYEATLLADWLVLGKPELGWRGDPRLSLRIGIVKAASAGVYHGKSRRQGDVIARRYEIWRHNEDGTDTNILYRKFSEFDTIIKDLIKLDPRTPGFVDSMTRTLQANEREHKASATAIGEAKGEAIEHLWSIVQRERHGRLTHRGIPGRDPNRQD